MFTLQRQLRKYTPLGNVGYYENTWRNSFLVVPINFTLFVVTPKGVLLAKNLKLKFSDLQFRKICGRLHFRIKNLDTTSGWALGDENVIGIRAFKGPFTNTCNRGLMQKKFIAKIVCPPPFRPQKNFRGPFLPWKLQVIPHRKACKLNFYWKICGNFFKGPPLQRSKILRAPLFASGPP